MNANIVLRRDHKRHYWIIALFGRIFCPCDHKATQETNSGRLLVLKTQDIDMNISLKY